MMSSTHKRRIVNRIANTLDDSQENIKNIVDCFTEQIIRNLGKGNDLEFRGFGSFRVKKKPGRIALNPKTQEKVKVAPKRQIYFKMGNALKHAVRNGK